VTFVGERKGFFQARGVQLDITVTPRIPDAARALAAGSFNTGGFIPDTALLAAGQGAPVTVVGLQTDRGTYRLAVAPDVTTFADLRGKAFAVGATNDVTAGMLRRLLRLNGLGPDEYDLIAVGSTPERYAALTSGQVAGVLLTEPLNLRAEREGFRLIADLAEVLPPFAFGALLVNRHWAQGHRDAVVRWLAGMLDSVRWLYAPANRDEAVRVLAEATGASEDDARISYSLAVEQGRVYPADLRATRAHLEALLDLMREVGTAPDPPPDLSRFVDESYLAEAQQLVGAPAR
jgi:ABC-type nitrate/sulfonate/bicarbonate transport system substrate-binding protein